MSDRLQELCDEGYDDAMEGRESASLFVLAFEGYGALQVYEEGFEMGVEDRHWLQALQKGENN